MTGGVKMSRTRWTCFVLVPALLLGLLWYRRSAAGGGSTTALLGAAESGDLEAVESLLKRGVNVNSQDPIIGETALTVAIRNNNLELAHLLLARGASLKDAGGPGQLAIFSAVSSG